ncbi:hypothetical protein A1D22_04965 [Pasteurellaceae bacterium LFhippo2]|nr:hypothetical protein [Pasteurellaceae bacterium LFhippo2]
MNLTKLIAISAASITLSVNAQNSHSHHQDTHSHHHTQSAEKQNSHQSEYAESMHQMHSGMMAATLEKDPDASFAKGMIPHHEGAVAMANIQLKYGKSPEIRQLAEQILKAQQPEIDMMNEWLKSHKSVIATNALEHTKAYQDSMGSHNVMLEGTQDKDPDVAFVKGMIPHHQGAVDMANIQLKYGKNQKMRQLAQEIIKAQEAEITFMKQWLDSHK